MNSRKYLLFVLLIMITASRALAAPAAPSSATAPASGTMNIVTPSVPADQRYVDKMLELQKEENAKAISAVEEKKNEAIDRIDDKWDGLNTLITIFEVVLGASGLITGIVSIFVAIFGYFIYRRFKQYIEIQKKEITAIKDEANKCFAEITDINKKAHEHEKEMVKRSSLVNELQSMPNRDKKPYPKEIEEKIQSSVDEINKTPEPQRTADDYFLMALNATDLDKEIELYTKAIELKPGFSQTYNNRGAAWFDKKEYKKAIQDYSEAIRLKPDYAQAYYNRGIAQRYVEEWDSAIQDYSEAIKLNPDFAEAYCNRSDVWLKTNEPHKAIEDANKALINNPNDAISTYNLACAHSMINELDKSIQLLQEAAEKGYEKFEETKKDKDFDNLRNSPQHKQEFEEILKIIEENSKKENAEKE